MSPINITPTGTCKCCGLHRHLIISLCRPCLRILAHDISIRNAMQAAVVQSPTADATSAQRIAAH